MGSWLHFYKIVENEHFKYPDEWFPSVSATIGDRYPERSVFQVFIAITSGPRFALVFLTYLLTARPGSRLAPMLATVGVLRTLTCGGWTYITSTDDHDWHDIFMISYIVFTLPWTVGRIYATPPGRAKTLRKITASTFFGTLIPLVYWFIQHKVKIRPGAYSIYAFFEWALIILDVSFDAITVLDFDALEIRVVDVKGVTAADQYERYMPQSGRKHHGFGWIQFIVAILNYFVFWSVLTSLPLLIWYFPLWHMGISGYEAVLVALVVGPLLLAVPAVRGIFAYLYQLPLLGMAVGVAAYLVPTPSSRLLAVGAAAGCGALALAIQFWGIQARPLAGVHRGSAFSLGLMLSSIAKLSHYANNPIWPIMHEANGGWNKTGVAIAVVSALLASRLQFQTSQPASVAGKRESGLAAGIGLGGLLCSLHSLLCDSSTLALWAWDGYPVTGPLPVPHGWLTLAAMGLGVVLGAKPKYASAIASYRGFAIASAGAFFMYAFHGWLGYAGGLVLTVFNVALTPAFLESAGRHSPAKAFGTAFLVLMLLYLAHVWIVAYAFVPGGPLLRERTDLVVLAQQLTIFAGVWALQRIKPLANNPSVANSNMLALAKRVANQVLVATTVLVALSAAISFKRFHRDSPKPFHPDAKLMTAGIWTIHFGLDNDMWASETRMQQVIGELELDVVGFLESDTQRVIGGYRDVTQQIAEELGYYADYGPGPNKHTWGCALLSKFPILNSTHHLLPSPVGELAPAIHATLDVYGTPIDVVVFHSGQEEDPEDRRLQSLYLSDLMANAANPVVLLSYLVTKPLEGNYNTYVGAHNGMHDVDPSDWDRWCQYILYRDIKRTGYARISRSTITDTEIQAAKFVVGGDVSYTNEQVPESQVPPELRFPALFRGNGVRGHRYHVFDEPRYFL